MFQLIVVALKLYSAVLNGFRNYREGLKLKKLGKNSIMNLKILERNIFYHYGTTDSEEHVVKEGQAKIRSKSGKRVKKFKGKKQNRKKRRVKK